MLTALTARSLVVTKFVAGKIGASSKDSMCAPVSGSISERESISSPKNSILTASSEPPRKTSTVSPRTLKVPLLKSTSVRL